MRAELECSRVQTARPRDVTLQIAVWTRWRMAFIEEEANSASSVSLGKRRAGSDCVLRHSGSNHSYIFTRPTSYLIKGVSRARKAAIVRSTTVACPLARVLLLRRLNLERMACF